MDIESRLREVEKRVYVLEKAFIEANKRTVQNKIIEMDLILPEADIEGIYFNETKVHAVFEQKETVWWQSRDILFLSARNTTDDNSRDILTKYLKSYNFKNCIRKQLPTPRRR